VPISIATPVAAFQGENGRIAPTTDVYARGVILKTGCLSAIFSKTPICCAMSGRLGVAFGMADWCADQDRCAEMGQFTAKVDVSPLQHDA
jgi:hypothetical protein